MQGGGDAPPPHTLGESHAYAERMLERALRAYSAALAISGPAIFGPGILGYPMSPRTSPATPRRFIWRRQDALWMRPRNFWDARMRGSQLQFVLDTARNTCARPQTHSSLTNPRFNELESPV